MKNAKRLSEFNQLYRGERARGRAGERESEKSRAKVAKVFQDKTLPKITNCYLRSALALAAFYPLCNFAAPKRIRVFVASCSRCSAPSAPPIAL